MHRPSYAIGRAIARHIGCMFVHHQVIHGERLRQPGPFLLACTHIGHLEPVLLTAGMERPVHWIARLEFYARGWSSALLHRVGTIPVNRFGVPVSTMRRGLERLRDGQIVGIFPEGGRTHGRQQAIHGGPIKGGVCLLAEQAGVPVVPVVVLDIDKMHGISPWLPGSRTTVRTIVGPPIFADPKRGRIGRRQRRRELTERLARAFVDLRIEAEQLTGRPA